MTGDVDDRRETFGTVEEICERARPCRNNMRARARARADGQVLSSLLGCETGCRKRLFPVAAAVPRHQFYGYDTRTASCSKWRREISKSRQNGRAIARASGPNPARSSYQLSMSPGRSRRADARYGQVCIYSRARFYAHEI